MARYFFDTISANLYVRDDDGIECTGLPEVKRLAKRALCEMATHNLVGDGHQTFMIEVRDFLGSQVHTSSLQITAS